MRSCPVGSTVVRGDLRLPASHPLGNDNQLHELAPNAKVSGLPWRDQRWASTDQPSRGRSAYIRSSPYFLCPHFHILRLLIGAQALRTTSPRSIPGTCESTNGRRFMCRCLAGHHRSGVIVLH